MTSRSVLSLIFMSKLRKGTTAVACAAVIFFFGRVDLLTEAVLDLILVVGLKANDCCRSPKSTQKLNVKKKKKNTSLCMSELK